uniref:Calpastatin n=1 Tax=Oncorhynchus kisutch TaxID=8019 RepID=A0A8C7HK12_ONCKI
VKRSGHILDDSTFASPKPIGKDLPPPKPEPSIDYGEAPDILSGDFMSPSVAPAVLCPNAAPTQASDDFALDALAGDFVAPAVAPAVKSAVDRQVLRHTSCDIIVVLCFIHVQDIGVSQIPIVTCHLLLPICTNIVLSCLAGH